MKNRAGWLAAAWCLGVGLQCPSPLSAQDKTGDGALRLELVGTMAGKDKSPPGRVAVLGNYAYLAKANSLRIVDISKPAAPKVTGTCFMAGDAPHVILANKLAYAVNGGSFHVIDVANPKMPRVLASLEVADGLGEVAVQGKYAFMTGVSGLYVVDIANLKSLRTAGVCVLKGGAQSLALSGSYAYVGTDADGLRIVDITKPTAAKEVGRVKCEGSIVAVAISGNTAYLADGTGEKAALWIVDVSNRKAPKEVGRYGEGAVTGLAVADKRAYLAGKEFDVVDVADPANPKKITRLADENVDKISHVAVQGTGIYVTGPPEQELSVLRLTQGKPKPTDNP